MYQENMQSMIQNGAFGTSGPMNSFGFNPYQNNIVPFGNYIQQPVQQPQNNGFVFQPIGGYQQSPYQAYVQQQQSNYYSPYGNTFNQNNFGYNSYGNSYSVYGGYRPFVSPLMMQQYQNQQMELFKTKYRVANQYLSNEVDEDYLDRLCNPNHPSRIKSDEELENEREFRFIQYVSDVSNGKIQVPKAMVDREADMLNQMSYNMHKEFDRHSLCQFLEEDLWRLQREFWIKENLKLNGGRDLSAVYNSNDYNELLKLHNSSSSYVSDLLNNSRYDNNLDDVEVGMKMAFERERRRKAILEGKVPEFISSDETQKRRHEWTQQLMNQIYRKGSKA